MTERQIKLTTALAAGLWITGVGVVLLGMFANRTGVPALGVMIGMAATVTQIRGFFAEHNRCIRQAFEVGRDHERGLSRSEVRPLR